jgi:DNA polymerase I-like protein with 3'-5' exonuclease and polymerase domains
MLGQSEPYPSLNGVGDHYKLGVKSNDLEEEYYSKKIDTNEIPLEVLLPYLEQDLTLTAKCYEAQMACLKDNPAMLRLIRLTCIDLLILEEMEWNGLVLDVDSCVAKGDEIRTQIQSMDGQLSALVDGLVINWNSGDQLSAILYGGQIGHVVKRPDGVYKTGKRAGQLSTKMSLVTKCERLVQPLPKSQASERWLLFYG